MVCDSYNKFYKVSLNSNIQQLLVVIICYFSENVIAAKFFHNGIIIKYHHDKKEQVQYSEKFQRVKFQPSVRKFGGVPEFGCIVITSTGMIGTFLVDTNTNNTPALPQDACQSTKSLGLTRSLYTIGDICFNDGSFFVAVADTSSKNPSIIIQCYRVIIERKADELIISSQSLPSFFNESPATKDLMDLKILKINWMAQEDSDSLIVASNFINGSLMEIWKLSEEATPIHKFFQTNKNESYKTLAWSCQQNYKYTSKITDVSTTKVQFGPNFYIFIAYQDNVIHCLNRESLKRIAISQVNFQRANNDSQDHQPPIKQQKIITKLASIDVSFLGHMLLAIDYCGQVSAFKLNFDHIMNSITQSVNLLEYCMVCGLDTLDSMLILKTSMLDVIVDKLSDNFNRQPNHVTQYYYVKFLTQKINLYRLSANGQSKAHDLTCLLNLISILTAFKSLLRPADLTTTKSEYRQVLKTPAENLAMNLSESVPDVDKVLLNLDNKLETKDFTVEPSTLQSLQQLIQFVADLALNILAKLPESRSFQNKSPGELSEIVSLNSIRELLVMIRIWGLVKKSCLPVFSRSADNLDILATLFRLLTKLSLNPSEPDELLLDECCLLPSQVLIPQLQYNTPRPSLTSPMLPNLQLPLQVSFNQMNLKTSI